ncbi:type II toxin-antitoxin system RelE/ParE family toxin [Clostridiaceae bacterium]|nr:type II toxin-antitoxin system RelE/ParE family toxin [Clostridiaceae bacterium]RKJ73048.1 type II toxin-antitoxin system RelE/ParE family toxin [Butyricicoccus sp. 1XD8-22]
MDVYRVKIYPAAKRDLMDIIGYLNTLSSDAALRYYDLLTERIASLSHLPERCPLPQDAALRAKGYRYLIVEKYLVFFVVSGDIVQIRRIVDGRRNYNRLL